VVVPSDPIQITAASYKNRATVMRGMAYSLQVKLTMPALTPARRLVEEERELKGFNTAQMNKKPLNTTNYALLVTVPAGGATNAVYRSTSVLPALKPASLKKPAVQQNGDLLWATVPMLRFTSKAYTRTFKASGMKGRDGSSSYVYRFNSYLE
jgi:hypothetical protein